MMTSLTILLHLILLHTLSCSLEYLSPTTIHEFSQIARQLGSKSIRAWILFLQLFSSVRSTSFYLFYIVNLSLQTGNFPRSLKSTVLSPLLKKPSLNHELIRNFRPMSNIIVVHVQDHWESRRFPSYLLSWAESLWWTAPIYVPTLSQFRDSFCPHPWRLITCRR